MLFKTPVTHKSSVCSLIDSLIESVLYHHSYCEAGDNVYEDVESVKKLIMEQNSQKRKAGLKSKNVYVVLSVILKPEFVGLTSFISCSDRSIR